ncbi:hypothetical protein RD792_002509 [Penstemon davidsonii]|uniref:tetraacyldisaccharide 4'-kinase n=1 Tax=Penstemon davidsonii TaxID=160366 RepID=A0ABR0DRA6_9LAMI|nr:hypothetical protein RD792_002509 [Penstemon davidsonii]
MEKVSSAVKKIAYTPPSKRLSTLSPPQLSLIPLLSFASTLYTFATHLRRQLYRFYVLAQLRLPIPVISVGNLTWGGNGKTPMVEFLARSFSDAGISPLILTRGYGGADEAKMLQRQLQGTSAKIGVGSNRAAIAAGFLEQYGYVNYHGNLRSEEQFSEKSIESLSYTSRIGVAILDDGMQHLSVRRDLEIVMVNAMMPWGNHQLLPLGPLREPLTALSRADIIVLHHADLVLEREIEALESTIREVKKTVPIFYTKMAPTHLFERGDVSSKIPLNGICNTIVLCISGIGSPNSFVQRIERDIEMVRRRLQALEAKFSAKPIVVVTEKDYVRAPEVFEHLKPYEVFVLCCRLRFLVHKGNTEVCFKRIMSEHLKSGLSWKNIAPSN